MEALYNLAVDPPVDATTRMRIEIAADNRREYARRGAQRWRASDERDRLHQSGSSSSLSLEPVETTGCCWSQDGKILYVLLIKDVKISYANSHTRYVGAENGIYEYHVNILGRKLFPSISFL
jgi:hypothetical protein